jgi:hypothetical protein
MDDVEAIRRLTHEYAFLTDSGQPEACAALFTDDAVLDFSAAGLSRCVGHGEILGYMLQSRETSGQRCHSTSNHLIDVDGDQATGRCYTILLARPPEGALRMLGVYYDDIYVRTDAGWRFRSRVVKVLAA